MSIIDRKIEWSIDTLSANTYAGQTIIRIYKNDSVVGSISITTDDDIDLALWKSLLKEHNQTNERDKR